MQKNIHKFEKDNAIQSNKNRTHTPILDKNKALGYEHRRNDKRLKTAVQNQYTAENRLANQANKSDLGNFFKQMLHMP